MMSVSVVRQVTIILGSDLRLGLWTLRDTCSITSTLGDIERDKERTFFHERGPKPYFLDHLADSARRQLKRKLLFYDHVNIKKKSTMSLSKVKAVLRKSKYGQYCRHELIFLMRKTPFLL